MRVPYIRRITSTLRILYSPYNRLLVLELLRVYIQIQPLYLLARAS